MSGLPSAKGRVHLLLIRHEESTKNTKVQFSSKGDAEGLTSLGARRSASLAKSLVAWSSRARLFVRGVYSTDSVRAAQTAGAIAAAFRVPVIEDARLRSTWPGALAGRSEQEAQLSHPDFLNQLSLYRKGVFNAYDFSVAEGKEDKPVFEARVASVLDEIVTAPHESLKIVVAHRSPLTATIIRAARALHGYPSDFFGYVPLDLGGITWLSHTDSKGWAFEDVNLPSDDLRHTTIP